MAQNLEGVQDASAWIMVFACKFYLHLKTPPRDGLFQPEYDAFEKVVRHLPRHLPCSNLYRISVKEDIYQEIQEHFMDLMNDPNVDGVFERQVPLEMRALLKMGKTCTIDELGMTLNRAQSSGVDLSRLYRASPSLSRRTYLDNGRSGKYIFLYHACSSTSHVHVFAMFMPNGAVKLHLIDPAPCRQPIPRLQELYKDLLAKRQFKYGETSFDHPSSCDFNTTYHNKDTTTLKAISRELGLLENMSYTVVISSIKDQIYFDTWVPKLSKFPVLSMSKTKAMHTPNAFPWQPDVAQKMVQRFLSLGTWLDRSVALADYYDVPIGHINGDQPLFLSDISFARRLIQQDIVLWWLPSERPDLGGIEDDSRPTEDVRHTEFISPGCYSNVCLEVTVRNLAVNSILHSVAVNELEGNGGATAFDSVSRTLDKFSGGEAQHDLTLGESNISTLTFGILKSMVKTWLLGKIQGNFKSPATLAIDHFWRWISTSAPQLHDPSIYRFVHGLMKKTFIQMLAEFKRLGSHVIYADFSRILLATSKPPGTAHAYATYITTAVTSHELFEHMYLKTSRFHDFFLFMDSANMGGIVCEDPLAVEPPEELTIETRWNIHHISTTISAKRSPRCREVVKSVQIETIAGQNSCASMRSMVTGWIIAHNKSDYTDEVEWHEPIDRSSAKYIPDVPNPKEGSPSQVMASGGWAWLERSLRVRRKREEWWWFKEEL